MNNEKGFLANKPELLLFLGATPAIAVSTAVVPAMGMAIAMTLVMLLTNICLSLLQKVIPAKAQVPAILILAAFWTGIVQMVMHALLPNVYSALGVYLATVAMNLVVVYEAEQTLKGRGVGEAILASLKTGMAFILAMFAIGAIREILGSASFAGHAIAALEGLKIPMIAQAPGGFGMLAIAMAVARALGAKPADCEGAVAAAIGEDKEVGA